LIGQRDAAAPRAAAALPTPLPGTVEAMPPAGFEQLQDPAEAAGGTTRGAAQLSLDSRSAAAPAQAQPGASQPGAAAVAQPTEEPAASRAAAADGRSDDADVAFANSDGRADTARLPSYAAIIAEDISRGTLQMQLHVHSSSAASRFVVINGARYAQGDTLAEGPVVEEIAAEGAILRFRGRQFLLTPN
ncbi:MAG TPA: general secretion pathway protein GspB, partial [Gammaproteobacteria bacterium]|nr:general secretion pathway protein GspB [Gammaproteobacteria bacterium]